MLGPLLASALSPEGLLEARGVLKHENILRRVETEAGVDATRRDPGLYYAWYSAGRTALRPGAGASRGITCHSTSRWPAARRPWSARYSSAPIRRACFRVRRAGFRLLAAEEDLGRELVTSLPEERRRVALIRDTAFAEIVTGNDPKVRPLELEGLAAADMSAAEQQQLRRLIELYVGRLTSPSAKDALMRLDRAGFGKVRFAWAGGLESGQKHYYRVHGPTLLIEYDNTQNDANHIHTVYRDLDYDFGGDALRNHLSKK